MSNHAHMFAGAMNLITYGQFLAVGNGFAICGSKDLKPDQIERNVYKCDISRKDFSVIGDKKVTCPECIKILK